MNKRSGIDWSNPPEPGVHMTCTLGPAAPAGPAVVGPLGLVVRSTPTGRKGPELMWPTLIYYVRAACLRYPVFKDELMDMLERLPPKEA